VLNVTKSRIVAAVAGSLLLICLAVTPAPAQQRSGGMGMQPVAPGIALLDVSRIFKNHTRFQQMMTDMKADVERAEADMKGRRDQITQAVERLKELKAGTPDYKQLEQQIATMQADLNVQVQLQRKEFLLREAKIYNAIYGEVEAQVRYYAQNMGIAMVMRYNGDAVDADNPEDVLRNINKPVVYFAQGMDITDVILKQLNERGGPVGAPTMNGGTARRPGVPYPPSNNYQR
jgi:Skp family chaperone for outer membrane proteins